MKNIPNLKIMKKLILTIISAFLLSNVVFATDNFTITNKFNSGETISSQKMNENFNAIQELLNKLIQLNNLSTEEFKDFVERVGTDPFAELMEEYKDLPDLDRDSIEFYMDWDKTIKYQVERGEGECMV